MARWRGATLLLSLVLVTGVWPGAPAWAATDSDADGLRDGWEERWGTDPRDRDSDDDGVLDPAEDRDRDGLSDLGEQRFRTSPTRRDTDGDGRSDASEDADRDGRTNAREQDRRRVPAGLAPSLGRALDDHPASYDSGCHNVAADERLHACVHGDAAGSVRVTLYGDSHAAQWLPALARAGRSQGWRITALTKSACPSARVRFDHGPYLGDYAHCQRWRARAERWIRSHPQDLVILTNYRGYRILDANGRPLRRADADRVWRRGMDSALAAMPNGSRVLVMGDTPAPGRDVPRCLAAHRTNVSACVTLRAASTDPSHDRALRAAAMAHGAVFRSTTGAVCPYDPCPVVISRLLLWRDEKHLTATYSRQLAPTIRRFVQDGLRR
jgi:hypothetical protein